MTGGARIDVQVPLGRGNPGRPITDDDLAAKFTALARHAPCEVDAAALVTALRLLPDAERLDEIMAMARGRHADDNGERP